MSGRLAASLAAKDAYQPNRREVRVTQLPGEISFAQRNFSLEPIYQPLSNNKLQLFLIISSLHRNCRLLPSGIKRLLLSM